MPSLSSLLSTLGPAVGGTVRGGAGRTATGGAAMVPTFADLMPMTGIAGMATEAPSSSGRQPTAGNGNVLPAGSTDLSGTAPTGSASLAAPSSLPLTAAPAPDAILIAASGAAQPDPTSSTPVLVAADAPPAILVVQPPSPVDDGGATEAPPAILVAQPPSPAGGGQVAGGTPAAAPVSPASPAMASRWPTVPAAASFAPPSIVPTRSAPTAGTAGTAALPEPAGATSRESLPAGTAVTDAAGAEPPIAETRPPTGADPAPGPPTTTPATATIVSPGDAAPAASPPADLPPATMGTEQPALPEPAAAQAGVDRQRDKSDMTAPAPVADGPAPDLAPVTTVAAPVSAGVSPTSIPPIPATPSQSPLTGPAATRSLMPSPLRAGRAERPDRTAPAMHGASSDDPAVDDTAQAQQAAVAPSTINPSPGTTVPILPTGQPLPVVVAPNIAGAPAAETRTSVDGVAPRTRTVADLRGGEPSTTPTASSGTAAVTGSMERARPEPLAVPSATLGTDARASSGQSIAAPVRAAAGSGRATMPTGGASTAPAVSVLPAADLVAPLGMSTPAMVGVLRTAAVPATPPAIAVAAPVATVPVVATGDAGPPVAALAPSPATAPAPALPSLATGAAGRVFAAALHAAAGSAAKADAGSGDDHDPVVAAMLAGTTAAGAAPLATQQGAAIDLRHAAWPTRMAEQIEALRDAADAASTTVRINPDALGPVELEVRRDGDRLHVHFTAAHPETRTLIADAQPQLAAAAAERGLKLGQTSVGGDTAGWGAGAGGGQTSGQPQGDQTARRAPTLRMPTRTATRSASDDAHIDTRIA